MRAARALLLAGLLLAMAAPSAVAQERFSVEAQSPEGAQPVLVNLTVPVKVTAPCSLLPNGTAQEGDVHVEGAPAWLVVDANDTAFRVGPCGADPQVASVNLTLRLTDRAPALAAAQVGLVATLRGQSASTSITLVAQPFVLVDASADRSVAEGPPQSILAFPLRVSNLGNALTRVTIEVGAAPEGWVVLAPPPLTLQSAQAGGLVTQGTVNVVVQTPHRFGFVRGDAVIPVWINATSAAGGASNETTFTLTARVRGFDAPSPGGALALAPLLVAAVLLARRAR